MSFAATKHPRVFDQAFLAVGVTIALATQAENSVLGMLGTVSPEKETAQTSGKHQGATRK